jgi:hypothetical protein
VPVRSSVEPDPLVVSPVVPPLIVTTPAVGVALPLSPSIVVIAPVLLIGVQVIGAEPPPAEVRKYPEVPAVIGKLKL